MAIPIVRNRRVEVKEYFSLVYTWVENPEAGFDFPCDSRGELLLNEMTQDELDDYDKCEFGEYRFKVDFQGMDRKEETIIHVAKGKCYCGEEVELNNSVSWCKCGRRYNAIGEEI